MTHRLLIGLIFVSVLLANTSYAQSIEDAIELFDSNPDSAFHIAQNYHIPQDAADPGYERVLQLISFLNYPKLSDQEFKQFVVPIYGQLIKTPIQPEFSISITDSERLKVYSYDMPIAGERTLHYRLESLSRSEYDSSDFLVFNGTVSGVEKTKDGYILRAREVHPVVVAGPSIVTDEETDLLISSLKKENWKEAAKYAEDYIDRFYIDPYNQRAALRYMDLYALAGMAYSHDISYEDLNEHIKELKGAPLVLPQYECSSNLAGLDHVILEHDTASLAASNKDGTNIHIFLHALLDTMPPANLGKGDFVKLRGVIKSIESNPNKSEIWVLRIWLEPATLEVLEKEPVQEGKKEKKL